MNGKKLLLTGLKDGIPIALAYFAVAFALGIAAGKAGFSAIQAVILSITNNASAGEYAAISMVASSAGYVETALMILVANARYFLMSCTISQKFSKSTPFYHRLLIGFALTDEIFAINVARKSDLQPAYAYGAVSVAIPGWALGTGLGVVMGNILPAFAVSALSTALFGMFIAIIVPPAVKNKTMAVLVILSFILSTLADRLTLLKNIPSGTKTIILTVVIALGAAIIRPIPTDDDCE
ncbi:MAG: AzlC family ABC transporter permease [Clostridia bacterium]|nr:AzlC family ABC transporter permease [Clostridia bacterium]